MTPNGCSQIIFFVLVIFLITKPMGIFMARVFNRDKTFLDPLLRPLEKLIYCPNNGVGADTVVHKRPLRDHTLGPVQLNSLR